MKSNFNEFLTVLLNYIGTLLFAMFVIMLGFFLIELVVYKITKKTISARILDWLLRS